MIFKKINKFDFIVSLYIFCVLISEIMGAKTFPLLTIGSFKLSASVAIFLLPLIFTINDVVTEVFGRERTKSLIWSSTVMVALLILVSFAFIALPPSSRFAPTEGAYDTIFGKSIRMSIASILAFAISDFLDLFIFVRIRAWLGQKGLWLRNNASNFVAQFFDTTIFMFFAFYALDKGFGENFGFLFGLILPYWGLKCLMSVIETPLVYLGVKWLKPLKEEKPILDI